MPNVLLSSRTKYTAASIRVNTVTEQYTWFPVNLYYNRCITYPVSSFEHLLVNHVFYFRRINPQRLHTTVITTRMNKNRCISGIFIVYTKLNAVYRSTARALMFSTFSRVEVECDDHHRCHRGSNRWQRWWIKIFHSAVHRFFISFPTWLPYLCLLTGGGSET